MERASEKETKEEKSWMEGPITKLEMRHQLFQHMKPNSAHGIDGFTVSWVKEFWNDLKDICELALNQAHENGKLSKCTFTQFHNESAKERRKMCP